MNIQEIKDIIQVLLDTGVAELEVQRGENRVWVRRSAAHTAQEIAISEQAVPAQAQAPVAAPHPHIHAPAVAPPDPAEEGLAQVKSPIVGTFYEAPSPESPPFVKPGDAITPGKVLCIIESMKLMNEIESEASGILVARLVENGSPVEYGQVLFTYQPA